MSFEDDMIEYGFSDANDYMDYLMDEADKVYEEQKQWSEDNDWDDWDDSTQNNKFNNIDELFYEERQKSEQEIRWRLKMKEWKEDCIIKLWENENSIKAKLWNAYYHQSTNINLPPSIYSSAHNIYERYNLWEKWLENVEEFEEYKVKASDEWKKLKSSVYSNYIITAAKKYIGCGDIFMNDFEVYNKLSKWIKANISLWEIEIVPKYKLRIIDEKINPVDVWMKIYKWRDTFSVWKLKNSIQWSHDIKEWTSNTQFMYEWIKEHSDIWTELLENNLSTWEKCYNDYSERLKSGNNLITLPQNKYIKEQEELIYFSYENESEDINSIILHHEFDYDNYWEESQNDVNKLKCKYYADLQIIKIWINKHYKQWRKWNLYHLWKEKYNISEITLLYEKEDYYNAWVKLYPQKYINWINNGYKQYIKCKKVVEIWKLWISDGNAFVFDKLAQQSLPNWEETKFLTMENDLSHAYYCTFYEHDFYQKNHCCPFKVEYDKVLYFHYRFTKDYERASYLLRYYEEFKKWKNDNPDEWNYWKSAIEDNLLKIEWENQYKNKIQTYKQTYKTRLKIKKLIYLSQIGYRIFHNGLAIVEKNNKFGFFDKSGEIVIPVIYDKVKDFYNEYASVCMKKKCIEYIFGVESHFVEKELWGIIDKTGKTITDIVYDNILQTTESFAVFVRDCHCGIIELSTNNEIIPPIHDNIRILDNGMWIACNIENNEHKWALISHIGNITPFQYSYIFNSDNDLTMVVKNAFFSDNNNGYIWGEWGYIDKEGNEIEELKEFDSPYSFEKYWIDNH